MCAVNFLFPFTNRPDELAKLLKPIFPNYHKMLPVEDALCVSFEWIGNKNYLGERVHGEGARTRGANFTSTDAVVMFENLQGQRQVVLVEWKYTESYPGNYLGIAKSGTDRRKIYQHLFENHDCVINLAKLPNVDALYYEPFYQLMRQQFLASKMEAARELGADIVSLLHIAPGINEDFKKITSPDLIGLGKTAVEVWENLVNTEGRFFSVKTEELFGDFACDAMEDWIKYIRTRYPWVTRKQHSAG